MVVVAEPLAAPEHWGEVTDLFLAYQQAPVPSFCHITLPYARLLVERGYVVNENGRETVIQVRLCLVYPWWCVPSKNILQDTQPAALTP